jgi:carbamoyl-phosphate synthase small subunit
MTPEHPQLRRGTKSARPGFRLTLDDGTVLSGGGGGAVVPVAGEVVFNTGMSGYPEALTDPSYAGQILVLTYPLIGNYGVPADGANEQTSTFQSRRVQVQGLVVQRLSTHFSHHLGRRSLGDWLAASGVPILDGVDTRQLTIRLRERGTMQGWLYPDTMTLTEAQQACETLDMRSEVFHRVAPQTTVQYDGGDARVLLVDVGTKEGIVQCLRARGARVTRAPWHADLGALAREADAVMLANGPGDPSDLDALADQVRGLFSTFAGPIFGICMGHQVVARAAGFTTYKLRYGHRGVNQPVRERGTGRCFVTSQNHGYAVDATSGASDWETWFENLNDGTNEGLRSLSRPIRSVQFHPEGRPGPLDTEFLFDDFLRLTAELRPASRA